LAPEDKVRIHEEIFALAYNANGGFTHDEVYSMPVFLRYFYLRLLVKRREEEQQQMKDAQDSSTNKPKSPARPPLPRG
jgi:hypothetical protein